MNGECRSPAQRRRRGIRDDSAGGTAMMRYTENEVMEFVRENEVKFIRLAFCDLFGAQKNISITAEELPRAFAGGISFDASAIEGFLNVDRSDLFLFPEPDTPSTAMIGFLSKMSLVFCGKQMYEKTRESGWDFFNDFVRRPPLAKKKSRVQFKKKGGFFSPGKTYLCSIAKKSTAIRVQQKQKHVQQKIDNDYGKYFTPTVYASLRDRSAF